MGRNKRVVSPVKSGVDAPIVETQLDGVTSLDLSAGDVTPDVVDNSVGHVISDLIVTNDEDTTTANGDGDVDVVDTLAGMSPEVRAALVKLLASPEAQEPSRLTFGGASGGKIAMREDESSDASVSDSLEDGDESVGDMAPLDAVEDDDVTVEDGDVMGGGDDLIEDGLDPDELKPWDIDFEDGPVLIVHSLIGDDQVVRSEVILDEDDAKQLVILAAKVQRYYGKEKKVFRRSLDWVFLHPRKAIAVGVLFLVAAVAIVSGW